MSFYPITLSKSRGRNKAEQVVMKINALNALLNSPNDPPRMQYSQIIHAITEDVGLVFSVSDAQILGRQRWQPLATARQVAMLVALESLPFVGMRQLADWFRRDRTTVIHSRDTINAIMTYDNELAGIVDVLKKKYSTTLDQRLRTL